MAVSHVKTLTIADGTNTDQVRPSDWNSGHNQYLTIAGNTAGASTVSGQNIVWAGGNNATLSVNGSTVSVIFANVVRSTYEPYKVMGLNTMTLGAGNGTSGQASFFPFIMDQVGQFGALNLIGSMDFVTVGAQSGRQTAGYVWAIYTQGAGANSTTMSTITSGSFGWSITGNNSSYSINQYTVTSFSGYGAANQTNSAGSNITSGYTGLKLIVLPLGTLAMSPGQYWFGWNGTQSTNSNNVGASLSLYGGSVNPASIFAPIGSYTTAYSSGSNRLNRYAGPWMYGAGSYSAANLTTVPVSIEFSAISNSNNFTGYPYMRFWST